MTRSDAINIAKDLDGVKDIQDLLSSADRILKWNNDNPIGVRMPIVERFMSYVDTYTNNFGCWIYIGGRNDKGYGNFRIKNKTLKAHRVSYEIFIGPIPKDMEILHRCDNPWCVNPLHLTPGTHQDNMIDMVNKNRNKPHLGEKHGMAKLTNNEVVDIYKSKLSYKQLAKKYNAGYSVIYDIKNNRTWKSVTCNL